MLTEFPNFPHSARRHTWLPQPCLNDPEPWQRMVSEFPELINVTSLTQQEVVRLYRLRRGMGLERGCRAFTSLRTS